MSLFVITNLAFLYLNFNKMVKKEARTNFQNEIGKYCFNKQKLIHKSNKTIFLF